MTSCDILQPEKAVSINELKEAFFSLKTNKSVGYNINFNIVKDTHREKAPENYTPALTKNMKMDIWVVGTSN